MSLAHAKGSADIADKQEVDHAGDNGHMQSIAHGTNRKLGQLVNKQHNQRHPASNTQPPTQRRRHIPITTQRNPLPSENRIPLNTNIHLIVSNNGNVAQSSPTAKTRQSEQGALKQGGIDLLVMPPKLKGRLPLWRVCSVKQLRGL